MMDITALEVLDVVILIGMAIIRSLEAIHMAIREMQIHDQVTLVQGAVAVEAVIDGLLDRKTDREIDGLQKESSRLRIRIAWAPRRVMRSVLRK